MNIEEYNKIARLAIVGQATYEQCSEADSWLKMRTLAALREKLPRTTVGDYAFMMAKHHYGSGETDDFISNMGCYPEGMQS